MWTVSIHPTKDYFWQCFSRQVRVLQWIATCKVTSSMGKKLTKPRAELRMSAEPPTTIEPDEPDEVEIAPVCCD